MGKATKYLTNGLLVFVIFSIGFAIGKQSANNKNHTKGPLLNNGSQLVVYYLHSTFRCETCNAIEQNTKELLNTTYSHELATGRIKWQSVDFQENQALADKFEVVASCVVVATMSDDDVIAYSRLDDVWTHISNTERFNQYISNTIDEYLKKTGGRP